MANRHVIRVFEHETLRIGRLSGDGVEFKSSHLTALIKFNERHGNKYFTVIHNGLKFNQYVGVIQCGRFVIEVLPKADCQPPSTTDEVGRNKWRDVLTSMLTTCRWLRLESVEAAHLHLHHASLLDIYIARFLDEVNNIVRQGLVKKYRPETSNRAALKGRLEFSQHVTRNLVHKERFYTTAQVFDTQHLLNQILYKALRLVPQLAIHPDLIDVTQRAFIQFPDLSDLSVNNQTFEGIVFNRKTEYYRESISLARLILLNLSPKFHSGALPVMAILFDMNSLFEEYIFQRLRHAGYKVHFQRSNAFWETRRVRSDIIIELDGENIVLDAKWKIVLDSNPSDTDLKQMYAYHHYFDAKRTFLVYPKVDEIQHNKFGSFRNGEGFECGLLFIRVVGENGKLINLGDEIVGRIKRISIEKTLP